ncbi:MAG: hypothetical protein K1W24_12770 [Lachnospiraceae bacterium]
MKTLCQEYISNVKSFFPIISKEERIFIANLTDTVNNFCEEEDINTITDLYNKFGLPNEVVNSYYSDIDISCILKKMRTAKYIKYSIVVFLAIYLIAAIIFGVNTYSRYKDFMDSRIYYKETIIR